VEATVPARLVRSLAAEFVGTLLLVLLGVGSAVAGLHTGGVVVVALAFGLTLLALAYALGPVSGCHVNPAVTLGVLLSRGMTVAEAAAFWVAQLAGAIAGAALLKALTTRWGGVTDETGSLGANNWGAHISMGGAFLLEVLLTAVLVTVVLLVTGRAATPGFAGLAIGLTLAALHLVAVPLDGTSVNPARSLGPALFAGGTALSHVWLFLVAPLVGGVLAVGVVRALALPAVTQEALQEPAAGDTTGAQVPVADQVPAPRGRHVSPEEAALPVNQRPAG
jgi:aquaporin Z